MAALRALPPTLLLLAWLRRSSADGAVPCSKLGTCGGNRNVAPDDPLLHYEGYVHAALSPERARLDRAPLGRVESVNQLSSPGVRISFATDALRVQAVFDYHGQGRPCHPDCPRMADGTSCYRPHGATCTNQCEVLVEIDGVRTKIAHTNLVGQALTHDHKQRDFFGEVKLTLMDQGSVSSTQTHRYRLTLPWGSPVDLKRIHVEHSPDVTDVPRLASLPAAELRQSAARWVAYGDAATLGWCSEVAYPTLLAERNGWVAVNLGMAGTLVQPEDGEAIGKAGGDLVTLLVGAGEWDACRHADVTASYTLLLANVRRVQPAVPIVVVTPTLSWREGRPCSGVAAVTPEATRAQIESAVRTRKAAGDAHLYLVDGKPLVPASYLADGLHPNNHGMRELASHLNAAMGFGVVQYRVIKCPPLTIEVSRRARARVCSLHPIGAEQTRWLDTRPAPPAGLPSAALLHRPLSLTQVSGLGADGWFDVYWGTAPPDGLAQLIPPDPSGGPTSGCAGRSLLLSAHGKVAASADANGQATIVVPQVSGFDGCHTILFQVSLHDVA